MKDPLVTFDFNHQAKVTQNVAQYPLHHMTYAPAKFEVSVSNGLGENIFFEMLYHVINSPA